MKLQLTYEKKEDIPSGFESLYTEKDGKSTLTEVEGMASTGSVTRLEEALRKEREDHKGTKGKLKVLDGLDAESLHADLDELKELRALKEAGSLGTDDEKVSKLLDARVQREVAPIKRELEKTKKELLETTEAREAAASKLTSMQVRSAISSAALESKMVTSAVEDALLLAERVFEVDEKGAVIIKDGSGFIPGMTPGEWLGEIKEKRAHWWPPSQGGGSLGGSGPGGLASGNPWSQKEWSMTEQSRIFTEDPAKAERLAAAAGSKVGAVRPTVSNTG